MSPIQMWNRTIGCTSLLMRLFLDSPSVDGSLFVSASVEFLNAISFELLVNWNYFPFLVRGRRLFFDEMRFAIVSGRRSCFEWYFVLSDLRIFFWISLCYRFWSVGFKLSWQTIAFIPLECHLDRQATLKNSGSATQVEQLLSGSVPSAWWWAFDNELFSWETDHTDRLFCEKVPSFDLKRATRLEIFWKRHMKLIYWTFKMLF
jgi:hypothetical protein